MNLQTKKVKYYNIYEEANALTKANIPTITIMFLMIARRSLNVVNF